VERTTIAGETEELGENLPQRHFVPPQIPHEQVRFRTPDRSGGKPATNSLSYGAALLKLTVEFLTDVTPLSIYNYEIKIGFVTESKIFIRQEKKLFWLFMK
jgi:hypothetical protein